MKTLFYFIFRKFAPLYFARYLGVKFGSNCRLVNVSYSSEPYLITLGEHVSATEVHFETHDGGVWIFRDEHPRLDLIKPITVGNNVFIGYRSIILPGVTIGDNVIIGAHSVVSRNIPSNSIAAGIPARVLNNVATYKAKVLKAGDNTKHMTKTEKKQFYEIKYSPLTLTE